MALDNFANGLGGIVEGLAPVSLVGDATGEQLNGTDGGDKIDGAAGNDVVDGAGGDDTLTGGAGNDTLRGGRGNDIYIVDGKDLIEEKVAQGVDEIVSSVSVDLKNTGTDIKTGGLGSGASHIENVTLVGSAKNATGNDLDNKLVGNAGANRLAGGAGIDTLIGGKGDDIYVVDVGNLKDGKLVAGLGDQIVELSGEGAKDAVEASKDFSLEALTQVENLTLTGEAVVGIGNAAANTILGNGQNNKLFGGAGNDKIEGREGNDILDGGEGNDILIGGAGADTYIVDSIGDKITEAAPTKGGVNDVDKVSSSISFKLGANLEDLELIGSANLDGTGNTLSNKIIGNAGNNKLLGDAGDDVLDGGAGNDTLDGGKGNDQMKGGLGNDTFIIDSDKDSIEERVGGGLDTVVVSVDVDLNSDRFKFIDKDNKDDKGNPLKFDTIENVTLGGKALNGTGNALNNFILGNTGKNTLKGEDGDDTLDGGKGADTLIGGKGNDTLVKDDKAESVDGGEGIDTLVSAFDEDLTKLTNLENVTLTGTKAKFAIGNDKDNVLTGNALANTLTGNAGNDTLNGGSGADSMTGGTGNDVYIVDNSADKVVEGNDKDSGSSDTVVSFLNTFDLGKNAANVENLILAGAAVAGIGSGAANLIVGNLNDNDLEGLDGDDTLDGGAGDDNLRGGKGNDTYVVDSLADKVIEGEGADGIDTVVSSVSFDLSQVVGDKAILGDIENVTLVGAADINATGNNLNNILTGNDGANRLDGGLGADTLVGGKGNDTYILGDGDALIENADEGIDTVVTDRNHTLAANFENLTLTDRVDDKGAIDLANSARLGIGNELDNHIIGNSLDNTLEGGAGADTLDGGVGRDALFGGAGNDTYVVGSVGDRVIELAGDGIDTVLSSVDHLLAANVENLILDAQGGEAPRFGVGNALDNQITARGAGDQVLIGDAGNDTLDGGQGADILIGGSGNDTYVVDNAGDQVFEGAGQGHDTVRSSVDFSLAQNAAELEDLELTGTAKIGAGNDFANKITGNDQDNLLIGGKGADTLIGGNGNDVYFVDSIDDVVIDTEGDNDIVFTTDKNVTKIDGIEQVIFIGEGGGQGNAPDQVLFVSIADAQAQEPVNGETTISFQVTLSGPAPEGGVQIPFDLIFGNTARSASLADLAAGQSPSGTVTFAPGATTATIEIRIAGDDIIEGLENFTVELGSPLTPTPVVVLDRSGVGSITDDATDTVPDPDGNGSNVLTVSLQDGVTVQEPANPGETATVSVTVTLSGPAPAGGVTMDFSVAAGSAGLDASDFKDGVFPSGTVTFLEGQTTATISFDLVGDAVDEIDETLEIRLSNPVLDPTLNTTVDVSDVTTVQILDDAGDTGVVVGTPVSLVATLQDGVTVQEPANAGETATVSVTVTLSGPAPLGGVTMDFSVAAGSLGLDASDFKDGVFPVGQVTFAAGSTTAVITFEVAGDAIDELEETLEIRLSNPVVDPALATVDVSDVTTVTILDDAGDTGVVVGTPVSLVASLEDGVTVQEPANAGETATVSVTVTLSGPAPLGGVTMDFSVAAGSLGLDASDFKDGVFPVGQVTFAAGSTTAVITFEVAGDAIDELEETLEIRLSNPVVDPALATVDVSDVTTVTILDDAGDAVGGGGTPVSLVATLQDGVTVQEPANAGDFSLVSVTVTLSGPAPVGGVSMDFTVLPGSSGLTAEDFGGSFPTGSIGFSEGQTTATITLLVLGDAIDELDESFQIGLGNVQLTDPNTTVDVSDVTSVTILDDAGDTGAGNGGGTPVTLVATLQDGVTVQEPANAGETATVSVTVTLSGPAPADGVTMDFTVLPGSAGLDASDFPGGVFPAGSVTFAEGATTATISFEVAGDAIDEVNEELFIGLGNVQLTDPNTTVDVSDVTSVTILDDAGDAPVNLTVSVADAITVTEPANAGDTTSVDFKVRLDGGQVAPAGGVTVSYEIILPGGLGNASTEDLAAGQPLTGTVTIPEGASEVDLSVLIRGDALLEGDETFNIIISNPQVTAPNTTILTGDDIAAATIVDDAADAGGSGTDPDPVNLSVAVAAAGTLEPEVAGDKSILNVPFFLFGGPAPAEGVDVTYQIILLPGANQAALEDFLNLPLTGTVRFEAGQTLVELPIAVIGDDLKEGTEFFQVVITDVSTTAPNTTVTIDTAGANMGITDDSTDTAEVIAVSISNAEVVEAKDSGGQQTLEFTIELSGAAPRGGITIDLQTLLGAGLAAGGSVGIDDLMPGQNLNRSISIAEGETSVKVSIVVVGDQKFEGDETLELRITDAVVNDPDSGVTIEIGQATGVGTVHDDPTDAPPPPITAILTSDADRGIIGEPVNLGESRTVTYTVELSQPAPAGGITFDFNTILDGGADINDFSPSAITGGTVTVQEGQTKATFTIEIGGDLVDEDVESFTVAISNPVSTSPIDVVIQTPDVTVAIEDDESDTAPKQTFDTFTLSISDASIVEPERPGGLQGGQLTLMTFTLTLSERAPSAVTVTYNITAGGGAGNATAEDIDSFLPLTGTITIPAGASEINFQVPIVGDNLVEGLERFQINLSNAQIAAPDKVVITDATAIGTILDDPTDVAQPGTGGDDTIIGAPGDDTFNGGSGNDSIVGGDGADNVDGGDGNDTLIGGEGDDTLHGGGGNDLVDGGNGNDQLSGDDDDDTLIGGSGNDLINGFDGDDSITGGFGDDSLFGGEGNDTIDGQEGNDTIGGGGGDDSLIGGIGNDSIQGNEGNDTVTGGDNNDTVRGGAGNDLIDGDAGNDSLLGNDGNDTLNGGAGNDKLFGENGDDEIHGGVGDDTIDGGAGNDKLFGEDGNDSIIGGLDADLIEGGADNDIINGDFGNDTILGGVGFDTINGGSDNDLILGGDNGDQLNGASGNDTIEGEDGNDKLDGGAQNDLLNGGVGNDTINGGLTGDDTLVGGAGNDSLIGGNGNDTYFFSDGDTIVEDVSGGTNDTVISDIDFTLDDDENIENIIIIGDAKQATGNSGDNAITGNDADNTLTGGAGNDTLDGGDAKFRDTLVGGVGNDVYVVHDDKTIIVENPGEGTDTVLAVSDEPFTEGEGTVTLTDPDIENLILGDNFVTGIGNGNDNKVTGNELDNSLRGGLGNDTLDGGLGADTMEGDLGDDLYIVDNIGDTILENFEQGHDTVKSSVDFKLDSGNALEDLVLTGSNVIHGTGNALNNRITGNEAFNILDGGLGADTLIGGLGDDSYIVDDLNDKVIENADGGRDLVTFSSEKFVSSGNIEVIQFKLQSGAKEAIGDAGQNLIIGNTGFNTLNGGAGADTLRGGDGGDTYIVDDSNDKIEEVFEGQGFDIIFSSVDFELENGSFVEGLTLTGDAIFGIGNDQRNEINGNDLANTLQGGAGDDLLDGKAGADLLVGGIGNDSFFVSSKADQIVEFAGEGTDTVFTTGDFSLSGLANVENMTFIGFSGPGLPNSVWNATGNDADNVIDGSNSAVSSIAAGGGNDWILTGREDNDVGTTVRGGDGEDLITFGVRDRQNVIVFEGLNSGLDIVENFVFNARGTALGNDPDDRSPNIFLIDVFEDAVNSSNIDSHLRFINFDKTAGSVEMQVNRDGEGDDWETIALFDKSRFDDNAAAPGFDVRALIQIDNVEVSVGID